MPEPEKDLRKLDPVQKAIAAAQRRQAVTALVAKGRTLRDAADELGLTFGQVTAAYRGVVREVDRTALKDATKHRARALAKIHHLQREAWEAYERFKRGALEREQDVLADAAATATATKGVVNVKQKSAFAAEAKILETIRKLYEDERKVLGVDRTDEEPPKPAAGVNIERGIVIVNEAGVPDTDGWLSTIKAGVARQGVGVLPPGTTDEVIDALAADVELQPQDEGGK
jgi:hypothetical protein